MKKGFTLIELIVAVSAFSLLIVGVMGAFLSSLGGTRRVNSQQNVMDAGRFVMESMAKEIRMSEILNSNGINYSVDQNCDLNDLAEPCILIKNSSGEIIVYALESSEGKIWRGLAPRDGFDVYPVTSDDVEIIQLDFEVRKALGMQPRVTISMKLAAEERGGGQFILNLQSTISSRQYDAESAK